VVVGWVPRFAIGLLIQVVGHGTLTNVGRYGAFLMLLGVPLAFVGCPLALPGVALVASGVWGGRANLAAVAPEMHEGREAAS
jgi:hypothetical protein